jgi:hypothetical protein
MQSIAVITPEVSSHSPFSAAVLIILSGRYIKNKLMFDIWGVVLMGVEGGDATYRPSKGWGAADWLWRSGHSQLLVPRCRTTD